MPQWCDRHKMHTIDENCPGCEADSVVAGLTISDMFERLACPQCGGHGKVGVRGAVAGCPACKGDHYLYRKLY